MNYVAIHDRIIATARTRIIPKEFYSEKHHIVPKCLGGGNEADNLISLYAKEHYIIHHLLTKIYPNNRKLLFAFTMLVMKSDKHDRSYITARMYEKCSQLKRQLFGGKNNPNFGNKTGGFLNRRHSPEAIEKIRLSKLGKKREPFTRHPPSEETRRKWSAQRKGRKLSPEHREKVIQNLKRKSDMVKAVRA